MTVESFANESGTATGDIDQLANQVGIHARREVFQIEINVIDSRSKLRRVVVAQVAGVQVVQIGAGIDECAARLRHLLAVHGEKAVREYAGWLAIPGALQYRRPEQRVEIHDVFADEVIDLCIAVNVPVFVKIEPVVAITKVLEARHVSDGCVEPDVEIFVVGTGNLEAEIRFVTRNIPVSEPGFETLLEFRQHILVEHRVAHPGA